MLYWRTIDLVLGASEKEIISWHTCCARSQYLSRTAALNISWRYWRLWFVATRSIASFHNLRSSFPPIGESCNFPARREAAIVSWMLDTISGSRLVFGRVAMPCMRFKTSTFWPKSWRNHAHKSWNTGKKPTTSRDEIYLPDIWDFQDLFGDAFRIFVVRRQGDSCSLHRETWLVHISKP